MKERDWSVWIFGAVVAVVLAAFAWMLIAPGSDHAGPSRSTDRVALAGRQASGTPSTSPQPGEASDQLQRCSQAAVALKHTLHHAAGSVAQWEVHVGAMNKLVTGVISLRQATAFWNQTRVGAHHRVADFEHARAALLRQGVDCPAPSLLPTRSGGHLRACARQVAADLRVLNAARTAIGTWRRHVHAMEMLRMGKMSPATATQMWLQMWHRGQHEIDLYRTAARTAHQVSGCTAAPAAGSAP